MEKNLASFSNSTISSTPKEVFSTIFGRETNIC